MGERTLSTWKGSVEGFDFYSEHRLLIVQPAGGQSVSPSESGVGLIDSEAVWSSSSCHDVSELPRDTVVVSVPRDRCSPSGPVSSGSSLPSEDSLQSGISFHHLAEGNGRASGDYLLRKDEGAASGAASGAAASPPSSRRLPWYIYGTFLSLQFLIYVDRGILPGCISSVDGFIMRSFSGGTNKPDFYLGILQSVFVIGLSVSCPVMARLSRFVPHGPLISLGLAVWCAGQALAWLASAASGGGAAFAALVFARTLSGVGEASLLSLVPPLILRTAGDRAGVLLGVFCAIIPVGTAAGFCVGAFFDQHLGKWGLAYAADAALAFPLILLCAAMDLGRGGGGPQGGAEGGARGGGAGGGAAVGAGDVAATGARDGAEGVDGTIAAAGGGGCGSDGGGADGGGSGGALRAGGGGGGGLGAFSGGGVSAPPPSPKVLATAVPGIVPNTRSRAAPAAGNAGAAGGAGGGAGGAGVAFRTAAASSGSAAAAASSGSAAAGSSSSTAAGGPAATVSAAGVSAAAAGGSVSAGWFGEVTQVLRSQQFLGIAVAYAGYSASVASYATFGATFIVDTGLLSSESLASLTMGLIVGATGVLGSLMGGVLTSELTRDDWGEKPWVRRVFRLGERVIGGNVCRAGGELSRGAAAGGAAGGAAGPSVDTHMADARPVLWDAPSKNFSSISQSPSRPAAASAAVSPKAPVAVPAGKHGWRDGRARMDIFAAENAAANGQKMVAGRKTAAADCAAEGCGGNSNCADSTAGGTVAIRTAAGGAGGAAPADSALAAAGSASVYRLACALLPLSGAGVLFLAVASALRSWTWFAASVSAALLALFAAQVALNAAAMLAVAPPLRPCAIALVTLVLHACGDVPAPLAVGLLKNRLAPHCLGAGDAACLAANGGVRVTELLVALWLLWMVFGVCVAAGQGGGANSSAAPPPARSPSGCRLLLCETP